MREVFVPTGFAAHPCRRPTVLIAVWLVVLQAFLAGERYPSIPPRAKKSSSQRMW